MKHIKCRFKFLKETAIITVLVFTIGITAAGCGGNADAAGAGAGAADSGENAPADGAGTGADDGIGTQNGGTTGADGGTGTQNGGAGTGADGGTGTQNGGAGTGADSGTGTQNGGTSGEPGSGTDGTGAGQGNGSGAGKRAKTTDVDGESLIGDADLEGAILEINGTELVCNPMVTEEVDDGQVAYQMVGDDVETKIYVSCDDNTSYELLKMSRATESAVSLEGIGREQLKKDDSILVYGSATDTEHWTAERVIVIKWE